MPARMDPLVVFKTTHPPAITAEAKGDFPSASSLQMSLARSLAGDQFDSAKRPLFVCRLIVSLFLSSTIALQQLHAAAVACR